MRIERLKASDLVDPQLPFSERTKKNQHWPKNQTASETPHSQAFVSRAYEDALIIEAMPTRFRGMASVFGAGLLGSAAFFVMATFKAAELTGKVLSSDTISHWWAILDLALLAICIIMSLVSLVAAIRTFRIDLLAPKQIPMVFNRRTRKVYRYAQDIPGFEEMFNAQGKFSLWGVLRYIVSTFRPWPNMLLVEYDWDCLEAEYYSSTAMAGNVVRTDYHVELFVRESPVSDRVIGAFALMPSIVASEEMGRDLWEHVRRFMEEHGPALSPGDQPAPPPPRSFWQALNASTGAAWILFLAGLIWTWDDVYWFALMFMKDSIPQEVWEQAVQRPLGSSAFDVLVRGSVILVSYFGGGWVFFGVLSSYLSREAKLPDDIVEACGAPVDLRAQRLAQAR